MESLDINQLRMQYEEFSAGFHANRFAQRIVFKTFRMVNAPEWPYQYFQARDKVWPALFGSKGTAFLLSYLLNGRPTVDIGITQNDLVVLESWYVLFNLIVKRAENCATNSL